MPDDSELLRRYAEDGSEEAFGELVRRRAALVYGAAFRQLGDAHRAREVVQSVFTDLARKATGLCRRPVLVSWLYTSTHFAAAKLIRAESRRRVREREAHLMQEANAGGAADAAWDRLRPVLDEEMHHLGDHEREVILLRFFDGASFAKMGEMLHLSEDAARKRVERALERLRARLTKRGITSTGAALSALLVAQSGLAAPAGLVESVTGAALASAAAGDAASIGILKIMNIKSLFGVAGVLGLSGLLTLTGVGTAVYQYNAARRDQASLTAARLQYQADQTRYRDLMRTAQSAGARVAELQGSLDRARAAADARTKRAAAAASGATPVRTAKEDGKNFLATFGQVRGLLADVGKVQLSQIYGPFYRSAALTPAQIAQFENESIAYLLNTDQLVKPGSITPTVQQLPDAQLRQILGDQGFQQFQAYTEALPAALFSFQLAAQVGYAAEPLTAGQIDQLAQAVVKNGGSQGGGGMLDLNAVDWAGVSAQAKTILSPAQMTAATAAFASQQYAQTLAQAAGAPVN